MLRSHIAWLTAPDCVRGKPSWPLLLRRLLGLPPAPSFGGALTLYAVALLPKAVPVLLELNESPSLESPSLESPSSLPRPAALEQKIALILV